MTLYDTRHLIVTLVALTGGGLLVSAHPEFKDVLFGSLATIIGFWFGGHANGKPGNGTTNQ